MAASSVALGRPATEAATLARCQGLPSETTARPRRRTTPARRQLRQTRVVRAGWLFSADGSYSSSCSNDNEHASDTEHEIMALECPFHRSLDEHARHGAACTIQAAHRVRMRRRSVKVYSLGRGAPCTAGHTAPARPEKARCTEVELEPEGLSAAAMEVPMFDSFLTQLEASTSRGSALFMAHLAQESSDSSDSSDAESSSSEEEEEEEEEENEQSPAFQVARRKTQRNEFTAERTARSRETSPSSTPTAAKARLTYRNANYMAMNLHEVMKADRRRLARHRRERSSPPMSAAKDALRGAANNCTIMAHLRRTTLGIVQTPRTYAALLLAETPKTFESQFTFNGDNRKPLTRSPATNSIREPTAVPALLSLETCPGRLTITQMAHQYTVRQGSKASLSKLTLHSAEGSESSLSSWRSVLQSPAAGPASTRGPDDWSTSKAFPGAKEAAFRNGQLFANMHAAKRTSVPMMSQLSWSGLSEASDAVSRPNTPMVAGGDEFEYVQFDSSGWV